MRKGFASALMIPLLLLTGCGSGQAKLEQRFDVFRETIRAAETISCTMQLCWLDEGNLTDYALDVTKTADKCTVEILRPELIAGVTVTVGPEGTELGCEGLSLAVGTLAGLSPATAANAMLRAMGYGYEELCWLEEGTFVTRLWLDDGPVMNLWLDENSLPECAEILNDGTVILTCQFENFVITQSPDGES